MSNTVSKRKAVYYPAITSFVNMKHCCLANFIYATELPVSLAVGPIERNGISERIVGLSLLGLVIRLGSCHKDSSCVAVDFSRG